jgi:hypothetical protein
VVSLGLTGYDSRYGLRGGYANIYREGFEAGDAEEFTKRANPPANEPSQSGKR